jgi:hypothetical protein
MASKKKAKKKTGKAVARRKSTSVSNWRSELAKRAKEERQQQPAGTGNTISLRRNGQFRYQGSDIGSELDVVIAGHVFVNKWYDSDYDEDNIMPPACFALGTVLDTMAPADTSPDKQNEVCDGCWANEWASGRNRGKACANKYRLAVVHADTLEDGADMVFVEIPPTSLSEFDSYVDRLTGAREVPTWAVVTKMYFDEDADYQHIKFEFVEEISDAMLGTCAQLNDVAIDKLVEPFDVSGYKKPTKKAKSKKKTGKKKTSRKTSRKAAKKKRSRFSG